MSERYFSSKRPLSRSSGMLGDGHGRSSRTVNRSEAIVGCHAWPSLSDTVVTYELWQSLRPEAFGTRA
jgi:hypothetical protein